MYDRETIHAKVCAALRIIAKNKPIELRPEDHLVEDLGFDSMDVASLTIALEDEFDDTLLLNDWIASASSPSDLTVQSLVDYVHALLSESS